MYSVTTMKSVVDRRLIDHRGIWNGSSEVSCKYWVREGKSIRIIGFHFVLLVVWTLWGAWVKFFAEGWII